MGDWWLLLSFTITSNCVLIGLVLWTFRTSFRSVRRATPGTTRKPGMPSNGFFPILPRPRLEPRPVDAASEWFRKMPTGAMLTFKTDELHLTYEKQCNGSWKLIGSIPLPYGPIRLHARADHAT